jgi:transposase
MPRREQLIGRHERDRLIVALTRKGFSHEKIAGRLGLSRRGVGMALARISAEGRPDPDAKWGTTRPADDDERWVTHGSSSGLPVRP